MMVSCAPQLVSTVLAGAKSALKDKANGVNFAEFIEAQRRSLTVLAAPAIGIASSVSQGASDVMHAEK